MKKILFAIAIITGFSGFANAIILQCDDGQTQIIVSGQPPFTTAEVRVKNQNLYSGYEGYTTPTQTVEFNYNVNPGGDNYFKAFFTDSANVRQYSLTVDEACLNDNTAPQPASSIWDDTLGSTCGIQATCY